MYWAARALLLTTCGAALAPENCALVTAPFIVHAVLHALELYGRAPARAPPRSLFEDDVNQEYTFPD